MSSRIAAVILFFVAMAPAGLSAANLWSYSLGVTGVSTQWENSEPDVYIQEQMAGIHLRGSAVLNKGFYYGTYFELARPVTRVITDTARDVETWRASDSFFACSLGVPLGYRWRIRGGRSGLFLGGGPAAIGLTDFDDESLLSGGVSVEFGMETLKDRGLGLSFVGRTFMGFGAMEWDGRSVTQASLPVSFTLGLGVSWTADRD